MSETREAGCSRTLWVWWNMVLACSVNKAEDFTVEERTQRGCRELQSSLCCSGFGAQAEVTGGGFSVAISKIVCTCVVESLQSVCACGGALRSFW